MSQKAKNNIEKILSETGGSAEHSELVSRLATVQDITEDTARDYVTMYCEKEVKDGKEFAYIPELMRQEEGGGAMKEVGEPTDNTFHDLSILEPVNHPMVPTGHDDYYYRRIEVGESKELRKMDVEVFGRALAKGFNVILRGDTGTGKDSLVKHVAEQTNRPVEQVNFSKDIRAEDLLGHYELTSNGDGSMEMQKVYGPLARASKSGGIFLADELNAAGGATTMALHSATEKLENRKVPIPQFGEVIDPHPEFRVVGTMNPNYAGTRKQNRAFNTRFVHIELSYLNVGQISEHGNDFNERELEVIFDNTELDRNKYEDDVRKLIALAASLRQDYKNGVIVTPIGPRELIQVAAYMEGGFMDLKDAAEMVIVGIADENDKEAINKTIDVEL